MDFVLNRKGGVPLHDQLLAQLELKILSGAIAPGQRLPSVRVLARRLGLHANTVSSAYRDLESAGHVELRRGAGVYVRAGAPGALEEARGLDEMVRLALSAAFRKGHSGIEIRAAVERWLRAAPPERVVIVDPRQETLDLMALEIRAALGVPASGCTLEELEREPGIASGRAPPRAALSRGEGGPGRARGAARDRPRRGLPGGPEGRPGAAGGGHGRGRLRLADPAADRRGVRRRPARRRAAGGDAASRPPRGVAAPAARRRRRLRGRPGRPRGARGPPAPRCASCASSASRDLARVRKALNMAAPAA